MQLQQLVDIKLGCFDNLSFSDVHILYREDAPSRLFDLTTNGLWHKLLDELLEITRCSFTSHDLEHLLPDLPNLRTLGIGRLAELVHPSLGESDSEESYNVTIGGLDVDVSLDQGLPFANERAEFVRGEVHAVEVC